MIFRIDVSPIIMERGHDTTVIIQGSNAKCRSANVIPNVHYGTTIEKGLQDVESAITRCDHKSRPSPDISRIRRNSSAEEEIDRWQIAILSGVQQL